MVEVLAVSMAGGTILVHTEKWFTVRVPEVRSSTTLVSRCFSAALRRSVTWQRLRSYRRPPTQKG